MGDRGEDICLSALLQTEEEDTDQKREERGEKYLWEDKKSICGRTGEVAAYCGRKTQSVVQQLQCLRLFDNYGNCAKSLIVKQKLATIVLDKRRWRRSDQVYKDFF